MASISTPHSVPLSSSSFTLSGTLLFSFHLSLICSNFTLLSLFCKLFNLFQSY
jgi:hypothetical protein